MHSFEAAASLEQPLQQYLQLLQRRRLSQNSLVNYRSDLTQFLRFIADYRLQHWSDLTAKQAQAFFSDGLHTDKRSTSYKRQLTSVKGFIRYLQKQKLLTIDPLVGLEIKADSRQTSDLPSVEQCQRLVSFKADDFLSLRDKAMIQLLINTPIELAELVTLDVFCFNYQQQTLSLSVPAKQLEHYQLSEDSAAALQAWLDCRHQAAGFDQSLFISNRGNPLTPRAVQLRVKYWREKMSIARYTLLQMRQVMADHNRGANPAQSNRQKQQALLTAFMKAHPRASQDD